VRADAASNPFQQPSGDAPGIEFNAQPSGDAPGIEFNAQPSGDAPGIEFNAQPRTTRWASRSVE
jgi:hypothetical protein